MITPNAPLPIVVIFERHWDTAPKKVLECLLPRLRNEGFNVFCNETPHDVSEQKILSSADIACRIFQEDHDAAVKWLNKRGIDSKNLPERDWDKLSQLLMYYVSSKRYAEMAERIKQLPASLLLKDVIQNAQKNQFYSLKGVDLGKDEYMKLTHQDLGPRVEEINLKETKRINNFVTHLINIQNSGSGLVFLCGATHSVNLINKMKELGKADNLVYYLVHSDKRFTHEVDDFSIFPELVIEDKKVCVNTSIEFSALANQIVSDVKSKNTKYIQQLENNSHAQVLSQVFDRTFIALERNAHYVDALLDVTTETGKEISEKLNQVGIKTSCNVLADKTYLVVPNVNVREVAENIRLLVT